MITYSIHLPSADNLNKVSKASIVSSSKNGENWLNWHGIEGSELRTSHAFYLVQPFSQQFMAIIFYSAKILQNVLKVQSTMRIRLPFLSFSLFPRFPLPILYSHITKRGLEGGNPGNNYIIKLIP